MNVLLPEVGLQGGPRTPSASLRSAPPPEVEEQGEVGLTGGSASYGVGDPTRTPMEPAPTRGVWFRPHAFHGAWGMSAVMGASVSPTNNAWLARPTKPLVSNSAVSEIPRPPGSRNDTASRAIHSPSGSRAR